MDKGDHPETFPDQTPQGQLGSVGGQALEGIVLGVGVIAASSKPSRQGGRAMAEELTIQAGVGLTFAG
jgi:hypothetical protein